MHAAPALRIEIEKADRDAAEGIEAGALGKAGAIGSADLVQLQLHVGPRAVGERARQRMRSGRNGGEDARAEQLPAQHLSRPMQPGAVHDVIDGQHPTAAPGDADVEMVGEIFAHARQIRYDGNAQRPKPVRIANARKLQQLR